MSNIAKNIFTIIQVLASFLVALYAMDISGNFISDLYIKIEGHYLPYGGLPYIYYFWQLILTGALFVVISYTFLYNIKKNTYITLTTLILFSSIYTYNITGEPHLFNYEIILGGLIFIVLYETLKKMLLTRKSTSFALAHSDALKAARRLFKR